MTNKTIRAELYLPWFSKSKEIARRQEKRGVATPFFQCSRYELFSDLLLEVENVRKKRHVACALDSLGYLLLVLEGNVRVLARNDLVELGDELLEEFGILVVDRLDTCLFDRANGLSHVGCRLRGELETVVEIDGLEVGEIIGGFREIFALREENEIRDDDFGLVELRSVVAVDGAGFEVSFDVDEFSFGKEGLGAVGEGSPADAVGVFGFGKGFSAGVLERTVGRDGEEYDLAASLGGLYEGILRDVPDEDDLIDGSHVGYRRELLVDADEHIAPDALAEVEIRRDGLEIASVSFEVEENVEAVFGSVDLVRELLNAPNVFDERRSAVGSEFGLYLGKEGGAFVVRNGRIDDHHEFIFPHNLWMNILRSGP